MAVILTNKSAADWFVTGAIKGGGTFTKKLVQGVNKLTEEEWDAVKKHPDVVSRLDKETLVVGVSGASRAEAVKKSVVEMSVKELRELIPTVTDGTTLEIWTKQEQEKGKRDAVLGMLATQLKLVKSTPIEG